MNIYIHQKYITNEFYHSFSNWLPILAFQHTKPKYTKLNNPWYKSLHILYNIAECNSMQSFAIYFFDITLRQGKILRYNFFLTAFKFLFAVKSKYFSTNFPCGNNVRQLHCSQWAKVCFWITIVLLLCFPNFIIEDMQHISKKQYCTIRH